MKVVRIANVTRDTVLCERCAIASNVLTRIRGLLGRDSLADGEGLLITPCPSIHMFGMRFPLDVVFLTRENIVTDMVEGIAPGKYYVAGKEFGKAHAAFEVAVGTIAGSGTQRGDNLQIETVE